MGSVREGPVGETLKPSQEPAVLNKVSLEGEYGAISSLTPREKEVLTRIFDGGTSKSIAKELGISSRTVEAHKRVILEKTGHKSAINLLNNIRRLERHGFTFEFLDNF